MIEDDDITPVRGASPEVEDFKHEPNVEELFSQVIALRKLQGQLFLENQQIANAKLDIRITRKSPSVYNMVCEKLNLRGSRDDVYKSMGKLIDEKRNLLMKRNLKRPTFDPFEDTDHDKQPIE